MSNNITKNEYLSGRVMINQPAQGYRAGVDAVLLAASIPAKSGQTVLELGTGVGTAALCLAERVPDLLLTGLELQPEYAALAHDNGLNNGARFEVLTQDITCLSDDIKQRRFDHVIANPPYFDRSAGAVSPNQGRETAMGEDTPLSEWLKVASRRVAPKGAVTFIHRAERLQELLQGLPAFLGSIQVQPLQARPGRDAHLLILRARHSGRSPLRIHAPIQMHLGDQHQCDAPDYTPVIRGVLRDGDSLPIPD